MRALVVAATAAATLLVAPAAHAEPIIQPPYVPIVQVVPALVGATVDGISGSCQWDRPTGTLAGWAVAAGEAALTNVTCAIYENSSLIHRASATLPGSASATEWNPDFPQFPNRICWSGYAYWSNGGYTAVGPYCRYI